MIIQEPMASLSPVHTVGKPILKPLVHHGGLRAHIIESGTVRVGDTVQVALSGVPVT